MHQVDVRYSETLARQAVRAFYWRTLRERFGWSGILAFIVSLAALVFLVLGGDRSWIVGAVGACLLFVVLAFVAGYIAHHRNTVGRLRRMTNPQARLVFGDRDVSISSDLGSATLLWDVGTRGLGISRLLVVPAVALEFFHLPDRRRR